MTGAVFAGIFLLAAIVAVVWGFGQRSALKHERAEKDAQRRSAERAWNEVKAVAPNRHIAFTPETDADKAARLVTIRERVTNASRLMERRDGMECLSDRFRVDMVWLLDHLERQSPAPLCSKEGRPKKKNAKREVRRG